MLEDDERKAIHGLIDAQADFRRDVMELILDMMQRLRAQQLQIWLLFLALFVGLLIAAIWLLFGVR